MLWTYFTEDGVGPSVWKINPQNNPFGVTSDYVVGYESLIPWVWGVPGESPAFFVHMDPNTVTPIDLHKPDQGTPDYSIWAYAQKKAGRGQTSIVVVDVTANTALRGNTVAEKKVAQMSIFYQKNAAKGLSVMRMIFINQDWVEYDSYGDDAPTYGPPPHAGMLA